MSSARWPSPFIANLLNETCRAYIVRLLVPYPLSGYPPLRFETGSPFLPSPSFSSTRSSDGRSSTVGSARRWNTGFNGIKTMIVTPPSPQYIVAPSIVVLEESGGGGGGGWWVPGIRRAVVSANQRQPFNFNYYNIQPTYVYIHVTVNDSRISENNFQNRS